MEPTDKIAEVAREIAEHVPLHSAAYQEFLARTEAALTRHFAAALEDSARLDAVNAGEWDISADHHCGGFVVYNRGKQIGDGGNSIGVRAAIDAARKETK